MKSDAEVTSTQSVTYYLAVESQRVMSVVSDTYCTLHHAVHPNISLIDSQGIPAVNINERVLQ